MLESRRVAVPKIYGFYKIRTFQREEEKIILADTMRVSSEALGQVRECKSLQTGGLLYPCVKS